MMQALGIFMSLVMIGSFFLRWESEILVRINYFLGIKNYVYFTLLGKDLSFLPIILTLALILAMALARLELWKFISLIVAILCLVVATKDIADNMFYNVTSGFGLWIFTAASLLAIIAAVALLLREKVPQPSRVAN